MDWIGVKEFLQWLGSTGILAVIVWRYEHAILRREELRDRKHDEQIAADQADRKARQTEIDERDNRRDQLLLTLMNDVDASLQLGEATARAVQRIPDAHCNGDMKAALEYVEEAKKKKADFLATTTIESIYQHK